MSGRAASSFAWVALVIGVAVCLVAAYAAYSLANYSWAQVVEYKSPYVSAQIPAALRSVEPTPGPQVVRRVVLVIVDGMREDVSRSDMPSLNALRQYGSDITLTVPQPSLSYPNWTTILTGASQTISGVTTNWYSGRVLAPTIVDVAKNAGRRVMVAGPTDFEGLYGIEPGPDASLRPWPKGGYLSATLVDDVLRMSKETTADLVVLHLPDLDEAGHSYGGASAQYRDVAKRIDGDIARLVETLQGDETAFVVVADHGHIDSGGHGGWEPSVLQVPGVFAGGGIRLRAGTGSLDQIAPTVAVMLGVPTPAYADSVALRDVLSTAQPDAYASDAAHHFAFDAHYIGVVTGSTPDVTQLQGGGGADANTAAARATRLSAERWRRLPIFLAILAAVVVAVGVVALASWRALVAATAGTAAYYLVYETLFFIVHRYLWSLSAFNTETHVKAFMNGRLVEAAVSAVIGVTVAAMVYPLLRRSPKGPRVRGYLGAWLALGPATVLLMLATLGSQVGWFLWWWGAKVTWILPDFKWGFKYDLDLIQMTAVGAVAVVAPLVTYLVGRYHPRVRKPAEE